MQGISFFLLANYTVLSSRPLSATSNLAVMVGAINRRVFSSTLVADLMAFLDEEEDYWKEAHALLIKGGDFSLHDTIYKQPCRTRPFTGHQLIHDILTGHPDRGYQHFRMTTTMFIRLRDELAGRGFIQNTRHLTAWYISIQNRMQLVQLMEHTYRWLYGRLSSQDISVEKDLLLRTLWQHVHSTISFYLCAPVGRVLRLI
ncbi:hypothetical protein ACMD2_09518 [Ananas comosus]|uniref:DUF8040 domain-containing protein n=1 Tax=Ananas comosus TaxID=4615 RepID=A0A199UDK0_ANACO|nr:hypothetical protein ACMD2_09518 [Ananas comosus]